MLSLYNIWTVAKFEMKTLLRSWFFRIFSILSILLIILYDLLVFTDITGGFMPRMMYGITSSIPYTSIILFNLVQAVITVFLASDFLKRDKKLDTTEAIYIRSMTNSDYILGKTFGILLIFTLLNLLILAISAVYNVLNTEVGMNLSIYLYYFILISLPSLVFIIGLSFFLMIIIRNQAVTFILLLGYIGTTLFYLGAQLNHVFDYTGFYIPLLYSDFIGFGNLGELLLIRGAYILLGLSFVFFTIFLFKRLPQSEPMKKLSIIAACILFAGGVIAFYSYLNNIYSGRALRAEMIELNNEYLNSPMISITDCDLEIKHEGSSLNCSADLKLSNKTQSAIDKYIFNLNPAFNIEGISSSGSQIKYERKAHLVIVSPGKSLPPGETEELQFKYSGTPDEEACFLDINDEKREQLYRLNLFVVDKRYSVVTPDFVLLTSESMWYPQSGITFTPDAQFDNRNEFKNFNLSVNTSENLQVISQGSQKKKSNGSFAFDPEQPLPKISLIIGPYDERSIEVDSVKYSLYMMEGHNYFDNYLNEIDDTLAALIRELKQDYERELNLSYPYSRYSLVETPIQLTSYERMWTSAQEQSQPEMVFLPENALSLSDADFKQRARMQERFGNRSNQVILPKENQSNTFNRFVKSTFLNETTMFRFRGGGDNDVNPSNPYIIFPNYFSFANNMYSEELPVFNKVLEDYLNKRDDNSGSSFMRSIQGLTPGEKAVQILYEKPLAQIISDTTYNKYLNAIIELKGNYLFTMLAHKIGESNLNELIRNVIAQNRFRRGGFEEFNNQLKNSYNINLSDIAGEWFNNSELPGFYITGVTGYKVVDKSRERYQVNFQITNSEKTDGFVKISFEPRRGGQGSRFGRMFGGGTEESSLAEKVIYLEALQSKNISTLLDESPGRLSINTLVSQNLPLQQEISFEEFEENKKIKPFEGEQVLESLKSYSTAGELVVDNEDEGFKVYNPQQASFLKRLLNLTPDDEKYIGLSYWRSPEDWRATIVSEAFGKYIHSAHYTEAGDGAIKVEWNAEIPESGYYDVYCYSVKPRVPGRRGRDNNEEEYQYLVYSDDGTDEVTMEMKNAETGWNLMGSYYISAGQTKVELTNKSKEGLIIADAVKWIKRR